MPYPECFQQRMKPADIVAFINGKMVEYHYASKDEKLIMIGRNGLQSENT